jgi:hypothetical protein
VTWGDVDGWTAMGVPVAADGQFVCPIRCHHSGSGTRASQTTLRAMITMNRSAPEG